MDELGLFYQSILDALQRVNETIDFIFLWGVFFTILSYPFIYLTGKLREAGRGQEAASFFEILTHAFILLFVALFLDAVWMSTEGIRFLFPQMSQMAANFRLFELAAVFSILAYFSGRRFGGRRWFYSAAGHVLVFFIGFWVNQWIGIIFISLPILAAYYFTLYNLALVVAPAANPEDKEERRKRFLLLFSYAWGFQSPMLATTENSWATPETRIPGDFTWDFSDFFGFMKGLRPGLVWTKAHQAAAITGGSRFKRVDGPGLVFTGKLERPEQIFDLRLQIRSNEIDVISKDGIGFKARVFAAFRIDNQTWDKETRDKFRSRPILRDADQLSHATGSFPYSAARLQATLRITSLQAAQGASTLYWDQWALGVVEDQARKVISQKNLDEIWKPLEDKKYANALDVIAREIMAGASDLLRSRGILLVASRVVNFRFSESPDEPDEISRQQIEVWKAEWQRRAAEVVSEAQSASENLQQEARAYAQSLLLNAIAEAMQRARELNPRLPRFLIAAQLFSALKDYARGQTDESVLREWENKFVEWQENHSLRRGKEK